MSSAVGFNQETEYCYQVFITGPAAVFYFMQYFQNSFIIVVAKTFINNG
jgi:hypothetical protein